MVESTRTRAGVTRSPVARSLSRAVSAARISVAA
jgi:hypothetical protein